MSKLELWLATNAAPGTIVSDAVRAEEDGWDGISVPDSQNLTTDPYVALTLAGKATSDLLLRTGVTNPVTRHPAVTASSILTVSVETGGRAVLGIGRGDSALAHIGFSPAPLPVFRKYLERVQGYLRGEEVPFDAEDGKGQLSSADKLKMKDAPKGSKLRWARYVETAKVPVDGAASGPKVIGICAAVCDRVSFAVGSSPERVQWAIDVAKDARRGEGLDPDDVEFGVQVNVGPHPDREKALEMVRPTLTSHARFSVMQGKPLGPMSDSLRDTLLRIHQAYDMNKHGRLGTHTAELTDEIVETFTIAGSPDYVVERLLELRALGVTAFYFIVDPLRTVDPALREYALECLAKDVLPGVRDGAAKVERAEPSVA
jgi:5,10-methylenetetrahydromethanopterin reductase